MKKNCLMNAMLPVAYDKIAGKDFYANKGAYNNYHYVHEECVLLKLFICTITIKLCFLVSRIALTLLSILYVLDSLCISAVVRSLATHGVL